MAKCVNCGEEEMWPNQSWCLNYECRVRNSPDMKGPLKKLWKCKEGSR